MALPFHGNCIQVFGTIKANLNQVATINTTYSIDHQDPITSTTARFRSDQYQQLLWSSGMIDDGPHTLTVTIAVAQNGFYWLDYVAYTAPLQSASLVPSSFPPVQTEPPSTALIQDLFQGPSQLGYPTDTPTPNTASSLNSSSIGGNHISTGGIVGVVISGVVLLSIVALLLFWYHKRLAAQYTTISPLPTKSYTDPMSPSALGSWESARSCKHRVSRLSIDLTRSLSLSRKPNLTAQADVSGILIQRHEFSVPDYALPTIPSPTSSRASTIG